jgi:hypothetical protein
LGVSCGWKPRAVYPPERLRLSSPRREPLLERIIKQIVPKGSKDVQRADFGQPAGDHGIAALNSSPTV